jgi:transcriptional antiterminator NusG
MSALMELKIGDFAGYMDSCDVAVPLPQLWYLLRIQPNREMTVEEKLAKRGVSFSLPKEKRSVKGTWSRRVLRTIPIFPGLIFVPDFEADIRRLKNLAEGIIGFVTFGDRAAYARPSTMRSIWAMETALDIPPSQRPRAYAIGQLVRIVDGPFDMWEGKIERLDSHGRLRVLLNVLERETPVEMDESQIEAV